MRKEEEEDMVIHSLINNYSGLAVPLFPLLLPLPKLAIPSATSTSTSTGN